MDYQILALDLDGTLTNSKKEISAPTLEAPDRSAEKRQKSGPGQRPPHPGVLPLADQLQMDRYGGYILSYNGGRIIDCRSRQAVYDKPLPQGVAGPLFQIIGKYPRP